MKQLKILRISFVRPDPHHEAKPLGNYGHGEVYVLRFPLEPQRGRATVLTVWIIRDSKDLPRLITCFILLTMIGENKMHDVVALLQDVSTEHFESGQALLLRRGQIGTVVMTYQDMHAKLSSPIATAARLPSYPFGPIN